MKKSKAGSPGKLERKEIERKRRIYMKGLCLKLVSLIPTHHSKPSKDILSQQDQLDQAVTYIKQLKERIGELKARRAQAVDNNGRNQNNNGSNQNNNNASDTMTLGFRLPMVQLRGLGSILEVVLVSGLKKNFMLCEVISILQDEGADVVSASFSTMGDKVFHTLHTQVKVTRLGVETSRVCQRLQELIC